jgi:hypothetical protein
LVQIEYVANTRISGLVKYPPLGLSVGAIVMIPNDPERPNAFVPE